MNSKYHSPLPRVPLLHIERLSVSFKTNMGSVKAVSEVCFDLHEKETLALVGETGCGKSVVASSLLQLLPCNASVNGSAIFAGRDLLSLNEREMARIRGRDIAIIFQNPSLALNPIIKIAEQVAEPLQIHRGLSRNQSILMAEHMLSRLDLEKKELAGMYPFQLSGGMNQRVMIATSMILSPRIIIADEPNKGLEESLARQVTAELAKFRDEIGSSLMFITHDLLLAREISDRMAVMYCGEIVESGSSKEIFDEPLHPYTKALLNCLPERGFLPIPGRSPSMIDPPRGCKFYPRCPARQERCSQRPEMAKIDSMDGGTGREVRCWLFLRR
ncbi:MAG: ABC transporter ATP-binding protein [Methanothrix sp.]|nr:ABC transporter ATP-binding protein [Methanothrix sp.]